MRALFWSKIVRALMMFILVFSALGKLASAGAPVSGRLDIADGVFPFFTVRQVMLWTGVSECLAVALLCLHWSETLKVLVLALFASGFVAYRAVLFAGDVGQPCGCTGHVWSVLGFTESQIEVFNFYVFLAFTAACVLHTALWLRGSKELQARPVVLNSHAKDDSAVGRVK